MTKLLGIIHNGMRKPMTVRNRYKEVYIVTFIDDSNRYNYVFFIKHKFEYFDNFKELKNEAEK